ncbi:hypothetical protein PC113_g17015 [Phytophthora cactorum]|uniref:Uncharacterized protein n=1 Tax=Phytophthora cactorum TaxID=29920 RepID=A0A8T0YFM4_9STRA|nr:hypothetical protein PC111_g15874 [Phytophthora cactorum]KAG2850187.1 hypothetical protein PC113_g17015 [Phytophthora cactorum]KAG3083548.1 hypothetical protein PC121_g5677 [Phytophthora cactorum]
MVTIPSRLSAIVVATEKVPVTARVIVGMDDANVCGVTSHQHLTTYLQARWALGSRLTQCTLTHTLVVLVLSVSVGDAEYCRGVITHEQ